MKKLIISALLFCLVAWPVSASVQKATLINSNGDKVVVAVGSPEAQYYFSKAGGSYVLMVAQTQSIQPAQLNLGGIKSGQKSLLDNATSTNLYATGFGVDVGEYNDCTVTTIVRNQFLQGPQDYYTFKFQGSYLDDQPNFLSAATSSLVMASTTSPSTITFSSANRWTYVPATNLESNSTIVPGVGTSTNPNTIFNTFSIDKKIRWLGMQVSVASTTTKYTARATTTLSAFVNCQK